VQVHSISIEQRRKNEEEKVHIDRSHEWQGQHGQRAAELIGPVVGYYCEGSGIEEIVVVFVDRPEESEAVSEPMIRVLHQVREAEYQGGLQEEARRTNAIRIAAIALGPTGVCVCVCVCVLWRIGLGLRLEGDAVWQYH
jgi:hypothetical protein